MKIYLDVCCLNRPFDDQTQDRIRLETEAVVLILGRIAARDWQWLTSSAVTTEIKQTPDPRRQHRMLSLLDTAGESAKMTDEAAARSMKLAGLGFDPFDALHLAMAEQEHADIFLTVDDQLIRLANRLGDEVKVTVKNPLAWIRE